jgi:hypothetical protein
MELTLSLEGKARRALNADFRGRKFVNPRTDVIESFSGKCEPDRLVAQPVTAAEKT